MHRYGTILLALLLLSGCLHTRTNTPQPPPPPTEAQLAEWTATCTAIWREELDRGIDPEGLAGCIEQAKAGGTAETIRENVRTSDEYKQRMERIERERKEAEEREKLKGKLRGRISTRGVDFVDADGKKFLPIFASELTLLTKSDADRDEILDLLQSKGFNGLRVFAGYLEWAGPQTIETVRARLVDTVNAAAKRGLYVLVTAITDSKAGAYDIRTHLVFVRDATAKLENVLLEVANEPYHGTQTALVNDYTKLCAIARDVLADYPNPWALGTGREDRPVNGTYSGDCGTFITVHLHRGGSLDDMIDGLSGTEALRRALNKPAINSEMIGAAEVDRPGSRVANPEFFGRAARRGMSYGFGAVFHSEDGLHARPWGPRQLQAAQAFVNAFTLDLEPLPEPTNPDSCDDPDINTHEEVVECQRNKYNEAGFLSKTQLADMMVAIAKHLNTLNLAPGNFGVLLKPGGNNCTATTGEVISCDIICHEQGSKQRQWDVLGAQEAEARPGWDEVMRPNLSERVCKVMR